MMIFKQQQQWIMRTRYAFLTCHEAGFKEVGTQHPRKFVSFSISDGGTIASKWQFVHDFLYNRNPNEKAPYDEDRVIRYHNRAPIPAKFRALKALKEITDSLIDELNTNDKRIPILRRAVSEIFHDTKHVHNGEKFLHSESDFVHGLIMYILRPTISKGTDLEGFFKKDLPSDFHSAKSLGLPLRGSDKCNQESQCLRPQTYMKLLGTIWFEEGFGSSFFER